MNALGATVGKTVGFAIIFTVMAIAGNFGDLKKGVVPFEFLDRLAAIVVIAVVLFPFMWAADAYLLRRRNRRFENRYSQCYRCLM